MFDVSLQCDSKKDSTCKRDVRDGREMVAIAFGNKLAKTKPLH